MQKYAFILLALTIIFVTLILYLVKQPSVQSLFIKVTPTPTPSIYIAPPNTNIPDDLIAKIKIDVSSRYKIDQKEITIAKVEKTDWPNSSLGCPKPGMLYLQMITRGYTVTVSAQGKNYTYHTSLKEITTCN